MAAASAETKASTGRRRAPSDCRTQASKCVGGPQQRAAVHPRTAPAGAARPPAPPAAPPLRPPRCRARPPGCRGPTAAALGCEARRGAGSPARVRGTAAPAGVEPPSQPATQAPPKRRGLAAWALVQPGRPYMGAWRLEHLRARLSSVVHPGQARSTGTRPWCALGSRLGRSGAGQAPAGCWLAGWPAAAAACRRTRGCGKSTAESRQRPCARRSTLRSFSRVWPTCRRSVCAWVVCVCVWVGGLWVSSMKKWAPR